MERENLYSETNMHTFLREEHQDALFELDIRVSLPFNEETERAGFFSLDLACFPGTIAGAGCTGTC